MSPTVKAFLWGLCIGIVATLIIVKVLGSISNPFKGMGEPSVYYDEEARALIKWQDQELPASITDLYSYTDGFLIQTCFIAFSGPQKELDHLVEAKTGKKISDLSPWRGQVKRDDWTYKPGVHWPKYKTMFYNPDRIKNGLFDTEWQSSEDGWHIIYDREGERVYYCEWIGF